MNRMNNTTIGLDIAKNVFHYAELNRNGAQQLIAVAVKIPKVRSTSRAPVTFCFCCLNLECGNSCGFTLLARVSVESMLENTQ